jgi:hypothetical protein
MKKDISVDDLKHMLADLGVQVRQANLCGSCRAATRKMNDGYLILVEQSLCFDAILESIKHEIRHILLGHLDDDVKTEHQMESEVQRMTCIHVIDRGECHKKIYSVN